MMEWIIVLLVILAVLGLVAYRYRRQIQTAYVMWLTYRKIRQQMKPPPNVGQKKVEVKNKSNDTELVRCPKCSKWTPQSEAVKLKSNYYCSHSCMEQSMSFNN